MTQPALDPAASPFDVPLSAGDDAFLLALAGSLDDLRLGAVLLAADVVIDDATVANLAGVLRYAFDRCAEANERDKGVAVASRAAPEAAVRRARWRVGAAWAYGRVTEAEHAQASDRGHALRRAVALRATREPLRVRAEQLMDRLGAAVGYVEDRLTAERLDAFEAALVAVEQAAAALVSDAAALDAASRTR